VHYCTLSIRFSTSDTQMRGKRALFYGTSRVCTVIVSCCDNRGKKSLLWAASTEGQPALPRIFGFASFLLHSGHVAHKRMPHTRIPPELRRNSTRLEKLLKVVHHLRWKLRVLASKHSVHPWQPLRALANGFAIEDPTCFHELGPQLRVPHGHASAKAKSTDGYLILPPPVFTARGLLEEAHISVKRELHVKRDPHAFTPRSPGIHLHSEKLVPSFEYKLG